MGGVGGLLAERLTRLGIGNLKITDPGEFQCSDLNRQFGSSTADVGRGKAAVIGAELQRINPHAQIHCSDEGIWTQRDADLFVDSCDLVADMKRFSLFEQAVFLQRAARREGIHYMLASAIGFGALVVIFGPKGLTLEEFDNLDPDMDPGDFDPGSVPLDRICPMIPSYAASMPTEILEEILAAGRPAPTTSIGVGLASILAANEVCNVLLGKRDIPTAPQYTYIDLLDRQFVVGTVS
jgi:molybdopterin/thiamine biosynthesis adenylyltransferase